MSIRRIRVAIFAAGAACLSACQTIGSHWEETAFILSDAELLVPNYLHELDARSPEDRADDRERLGMHAHRVSRGGGLVIGLRRYNGGGLLVSDDESFEKLTVFVPPAKSSLPLRAQLDADKDIAVIVTEGGSAWPREACSGYVQSGQLSVSQQGKRYHVSISGTLAPAGNRDVWDHCKAARQVNYSFDATVIAFKELTPWLGLPTDNPYGDSYPQ